MTGAPVEDYGRAVQAGKNVSGMIRASQPAQLDAKRPSRAAGALLRFWRRLTCGHGWHRWEPRLGLDLADFDVLQAGELVIGRFCPRCGEIQVDATHTVRRGTVVRYPPYDLQVIE